MDETTAEVIIITINALGAGILFFVSGIAQKLMDDMDAMEFKLFMNKMGRTAMTDPFSVTIATIPLFALVFYFAAFGFGHGWFIFGALVWLIASIITKVVNLPVYNWLGDPKNTDPGQLRQKRDTLRMGNKSRAWLTLVSIVLMLLQFSVGWTLIAVLACLIIYPPTIWLANKYIPS
jgi:hypothetical protein